MKGTVLVFDVETSGLLNKEKPIEKQPFILQMSYLIYDIVHQKCIKAVDSYIQVDPSVIITPEITKINHCTRDKCDNGVPITKMLVDFYQDVHSVENVIAHNFDFDSNMVRLEFQRNWHELKDITPHGLQLFDPHYLRSEGITRLCTMLDTTKMVKAPHKNPKPDDERNGNFKWPTLIELNVHLFGKVPENMHNSAFDVLATIRAFMKYKYNVSLTQREMDMIVEAFDYSIMERESE